VLPWPGTLQGAAHPKTCGSIDVHLLMFITVALIDLGTFKEIHDLFDDHIIDLHLLSDRLCLLSSSPQSARSAPHKSFSHFLATALPYCLNGRREEKGEKKKGEAAAGGVFDMWPKSRKSQKEKKKQTKTVFLKNKKSQ
jgi:hypothetical protein